MDIGKADLADLELLVPLFDAYRQFYKAESSPDGARAFLRERLEAGDSTILLARSGGKAAGFVQLYPLFTSVGMAPVLLLNDLFVHADFRRKGVARALLEAAESFAKSVGVARLRLSTQHTNTSAQKLYEAMGWQLDREFRTYNRAV